MYIARYAMPPRIMRVPESAVFFTDREGNRKAGFYHTQLMRITRSSKMPFRVVNMRPRCRRVCIPTVQGPYTHRSDRHMDIASVITINVYRKLRTSNPRAAHILRTLKNNRWDREATE